MKIVSNDSRGGHREHRDSVSMDWMFKGLRLV